MSAEDRSKRKTFDDLEAVAKALIADGVSTPTRWRLKAA
jgi:hypothetical protein